MSLTWLEGGDGGASLIRITGVLVVHVSTTVFCAPYYADVIPHVGRHGPSRVIALLVVPHGSGKERGNPTKGGIISDTRIAVLRVRYFAAGASREDPRLGKLAFGGSTRAKIGGTSNIY
jgi:hypothetical protein